MSERPGESGRLSNESALARARYKELVVSSILAVSFLVLSARSLSAQVNDARNDGDDARYDALLGTPNAYTPTPDGNLFATAPGLEQQAPRSQVTVNGLAPFFYNSNAEALSSGGTTSTEFSPLAAVSWTTPVADTPLKFTANVRAEFDRFLNASNADFDKLRALARLQYVDPDNDQAYSPYFSYVPRVDFDPTFASRFATRQDLNIGFNKTFNFDGNFNRVGFSSSSSADTVLSFGLTAIFQRRFRNPRASSFAGIVIPSVSYVISPQWNVSGGLEVEHRAFDSIGGFSQKDWFIEPIGTLEFVMPDGWFGGNAGLVGRPALDFQVSYERNWSNLAPDDFGILRAGAALKLGWRF